MHLSKTVDKMLRHKVDSHLIYYQQLTFHTKQDTALEKGFTQNLDATKLRYHQ